MREPIFLDQPLDCAQAKHTHQQSSFTERLASDDYPRERLTCIYNLFMGRDVVKCLRSILLYPGRVLLAIYHHGGLSLQRHFDVYSRSTVLSLAN